MSALTGSRYNIMIPLEGDRILAYNSLSGSFSLWQDYDVDHYHRVVAGEPLSLHNPSVQELIRGGYLVPNDVDELEVFEQQYRAHRFNKDALIMTIAPTLACNFGCDYCFQGEDKPGETMGEEVQDAIVTMVARAASTLKLKRIGVAWYGGEPLLRVGVIESLSDRMIAQCVEQGVNYEASMVTNGFKLTAEVARSMYKRRVKTAQITIDGAPHYHDKRRILLSGKPTFNRIADNLAEVVDAVPMNISIRVNIDHRNANQIRGLIDHLDELGLSGRKNLNMYFAPIEAITEGCHTVSHVTMGKKDYGKLEAELHRYAYEKGLAQLPYPPRFHGTCAAVRPTGMVVTPSGDIHKCWDTVTFPEHAVGTIFDLDALRESDKMKRWNEWSPLDNDTCRNCKILPNCAGACAYKFLHSDLTRGEAAVLPCPSWKYNIKERLVIRAEKTGVISAGDYDPDKIATDPKELCADVHVPGGQSLPAEMEALMAAAGPPVAKPRSLLPVLPASH